MADLRELPLILLEALVRKPEDGKPEGLAIAVAPRTRQLIFQVALEATRFATFNYDRPCTFAVSPDDALRLAHDILRVYAPEVARLLERAAEHAELRLLSGGAGGPEAA